MRYLILCVLFALGNGFDADGVRARHHAMTHEAEHPTHQHDADTVPLYDNLGTHAVPITTTSDLAQQYFNQGVRLTYGFNHGEAIRAFREAARLDTTCAMCYWGIANAYGPNINLPMDSASSVLAYEALQEALARRQHASPREQAYIDAMANRYALPPPDDRAPLDTAYAKAMGEIAAAYPEDLEAATLYAEALMDLSPWYYWEDGEPRPDTPTILASLERVIEANPNHPGACHFYIHAVEAAQPEKAVPCADRLAGLMPGAGHIVHMPAHIYIRVGRWNDAIEANHHATHTDETYIADQRPTGAYPLGYYPHNYHFLAFAASMAGRAEEAINAARGASERMPLEGAMLTHELEGIVPYHTLTLVRFGRWDEVLQQPLPDPVLDYASGLTHYARGVAFAATEQFDQAEAALDSVRARVALVEKDPGHTVLQIAEKALEGEIAGRRGDVEASITAFRAATDLEDGLIYIEPPFWYYPMRHSLGAMLLEAGRPEEAEQAYREDLERFPANGWSLYGLAQSLRAQGRDAEAAEVDAVLAESWEKADVDIAASTF